MGGGGPVDIVRGGGVGDLGRWGCGGPVDIVRGGGVGTWV